MPQINVKIAGQNYNMSCGIGQEDKITALAAIVDAKFNELAKNIGYATDNFVFAALAIILCDEIETLKMQPGIIHSKPQMPNKLIANNNSADKILEEVINYIETLAIKLEKV